MASSGFRHGACVAFTLVCAAWLGACDGGASGEQNGSGAPDVPGVAPAPADDAGTSGSALPTSDDGWFHDVTEVSGLVFTHDAGLLPEKHLPETMGAGAALVDLDEDGDLDAYLVQSGPMYEVAPPDPAKRNSTFLNDGRGRFTDATEASGDGAHSGYGMGVAAGDVDADGDVDLAVTNLGPDVLLLNDGAARFTDGTAASGYADDRWTGAAAFFDADGDGDLDLYVAAYVQVDLTDPMWCGRRDPGWRSACHPDAYPGLADRFWRNDGDGRFRDDTRAAGLATEPGDHGKGLGVLIVDIDDDADLDLYVANDSVENRLWRNDGSGTFEDLTLWSGTGVNARGLTEAGMGVAQGDVDADGDLDLFVTNFDDESNTLYLNEGEGMFRDGTARAGLDAPSRLPVGFGTVLSDLDSDGDLDVAVTNGHIIDNIPLYHDGKTHAQRALLFANRGDGRFDDVSAQAGALTDREVVGRGLYDGDLDGDGDLDLLVTVCGGPARVLANAGAPPGVLAGHAILLTGLPPGTRVEAVLDDGRRLQRLAGPASSYFGQTSPDVHLGLGGAALQAVTLTDILNDRRTLTFDRPVTRGRFALLDDGSLATAQPDGPSARPTPQETDR
jgi:hypothetical protein